MRATSDFAKLEANASAIARMLKLFANERRVGLLFHLEAAGNELSVATIAASLRIGQSALSQHLARLRESGVIAARRDGHKLFYRIADPKAAALLIALKGGKLGWCAEPEKSRCTPRSRQNSFNKLQPGT